MSEIVQSKSSISISSLVDTLTSLKREIYQILHQALEVDQKVTSYKNKPAPGDYDTAKILYDKSLALTEKAIQFYNTNVAKLAGNEEAIRTLNKLNSIKTQTVDRLKVLNTTPSDIDIEFLDISDDVLLVDDVENNIIVVDEIPAYPKLSDLKPTTENNDCTVFVEKNEQPLNDYDSKKATEIFRMENNAQLFFIGTDGSVSTPTSMRNISVYSFDQDSQFHAKEKKISGFIKCGEWMYPLIPNDNPGMKTNFNAYIFPNNDSEMNKNIESPSAECTFIGISFDTKNMLKEQITFFEDVLINFNSLVYQDTSKETDVKVPFVTNHLDSKQIIIDGTEPEKRPIGEQEEVLDKDEEKKIDTWSAENIADSIITGADYITKGVETSTEYAAKYIGLGGEKLKNNLVPNSTPAKIDPTMRKVAENVRYGTNLTVKVSSYLVNKLGSLATYTAKTVAPHIRDGTSAIMTKTGIAGDKTSASSTLDNVCKVGGSSLKSVVMVYDSLEKAAFSLGKNFTEQTVTVVDFKYGSEAAKLTENSLYSAGNVAQTVNNARGMKVTRTFAKATAKEAILHEKEKTAKKLNDVELDHKEIEPINNKNSNQKK